VALADVGRLSVGQRARITCEALGERVLAGVVTRIDGMADVARNTLQAKVSITQGDPLLRPEMLCRVQFFGNDSDNTNTTSGSGRVQLLLPATAVGGGAESERELWTVTADNRVQRVRVRLGQRSGDHVEVIDGLTAGAWVIRNAPAGLAVGERVLVREAP
jgi:multidrug efflux pump subunit AcrA (membrane-fusion protein)